MTKPRSLAALSALFLSLLFCVRNARAGDWIGIYGAIDRVVFEPTADRPERVHLYFTLPAAKSSAALRDWAVLAAIAGKREVVGFGVRYTANEFPVRLRKPDEAPKEPGIYMSAEGDLPRNPDNLMAVREGVIRQEYHGGDYPPVKSLLELMRRVAP